MTFDKLLLATALSSAAMLSAAQAEAATYKFVVVDPTLTQNGAPLDGNRYTFFLDSNPVPAVHDATTFTLSGSATYTAGVFGSYRVDGMFMFYTLGDGGGLYTPLNSYYGDQLFTGSTTTPMFRLGTFALDVGTITISDTTATAVPEPATWGMMLLGFGMIGAAARRRRATTTVRFA